MSIKFYHWIPNDIVVISDVVFCMQAPLQARKARLENAERLKKYNHDVEDEEAWIREKEPIVSSTNTGTGCVWTFPPTVSLKMKYCKKFRIIFSLQTYFLAVVHLLHGVCELL